MAKKRPNRDEQIGNTIQSVHRKIWCFTLNNYTNEEIETILQYFCKDKYVIGKEIGEQGTPHLQGHVEFEKRKRLTELKKLNPRIHWEATRNKIASKDYCKKDGDYITNIKMPRKIKFPAMDKPWQIEILDLIKEEPDDRTIYWYWENTGGVGKTTFLKYLKVHNDAIQLPSKSNDAFHCIAKLVEKDIPIDLCIFDIPRTSLDFINYGTIEKIKDGCFSSGKYEGLDICIACPHVIVFANEPPDLNKMSKDRWIVRRIKV